MALITYTKTDGTQTKRAGQLQQELWGTPCGGTPCLIKASQGYLGGKVGDGLVTIVGMVLYIYLLRA